MTHSVPQFTCKNNDGYLAFIIPFYYKSQKYNKNNLCERFFKEIREREKKEKDKTGDRITAIYEDYKGQLCNAITNSNSSLFAPQHNMAIDNQNCTCKHLVNYKGRNLCDCLSTSRRFHEENIQAIPRLEIALGLYNVRYEENFTKEGAHFAFQMRTSLLLNGLENNECGYLLLSIPLASIDESGFGSDTKNKLDNIIFLKHLFYKQRLQCSIKNDKTSRSASLQQWTDTYLQEIFKALHVDYPNALNKYIYKDIESGREGSAFRYSIIELNDIVDEKGNIIRLTPMNEMLNMYHKQLYGILSSDEGWRHLPDNEKSTIFDKKYWMSRDYNFTIYFNHNALIVNQYDSDEYKTYTVSAMKWMSHYVNVKDDKNTLSFYQDHFIRKSCLPGASSLKFDIFLRVIYKEMMIERAIEATNKQKLPESKFRMLEKALQSYSTSLDAVRSAEDIICIQFGIPAAINRLRESYTREANNMQDSRVFDLTTITASISIAALLVAFSHIALTALDYKKGFIVTIKQIFSLEFWHAHTEYIIGFGRMFFICICTTIIVYLIIYWLFKKVWYCWDLYKMKKRK